MSLMTSDICSSWSTAHLAFSAVLPARLVLELTNTAVSALCALARWCIRAGSAADAGNCAHIRLVKALKALDAACLALVVLEATGIAAGTVSLLLFRRVLALLALFALL